MEKQLWFTHDEGDVMRCHVMSRHVMCCDVLCCYALCHPPTPNIVSHSYSRLSVQQELTSSAKCVGLGPFAGWRMARIMQKDSRSIPVQASRNLE